MRERRIGLALLVLALLVLAARHPSVTISIDTHDGSDPAPHTMQAAIDVGLAGVSLLWTWSGRHLID
ncbi:hypothetical protein [Hephaestia mangrovi]|jgi:hypothetical protein|uniref:hypothetical protein n=1 Tax=Hephaestia mangrovi TaxID=2873268 RepID=UPI001CA66767|nr:hypothetical protein [Hephaestia mangrovi]MBY8828714.1 hypothetical protein [Hephaestia mangrovi]